MMSRQVINLLVIYIYELTECKAQYSSENRFHFKLFWMFRVCERNTEKLFVLTTRLLNEKKTQNLFSSMPDRDSRGKDVRKLMIESKHSASRMQQKSEI